MDDKHKTAAQGPGRQADGGQVDAAAAVRRQQDLAAQVLQLQDALHEARLLAEQSQARCEALEGERREALAAAGDAETRARALQNEFETLQRQFETRIAELRAALDTLRPREGDPPHRAGAG